MRTIKEEKQSLFPGDRGFSFHGKRSDVFKTVGQRESAFFLNTFGEYAVTSNTAKEKRSMINFLVLLTNFKKRRGFSGRAILFDTCDIHT